MSGAFELVSLPCKASLPLCPVSTSCGAAGPASAPQSVPASVPQSVLSWVPSSDARGEPGLLQVAAPSSMYRYLQVGWHGTEGVTWVQERAMQVQVQGADMQLQVQGAGMQAQVHGADMQVQGRRRACAGA